MRLKNILVGLSWILVSGLHSCVDDRGNYDYTDVDELIPITISGLEDTTVMMRSVLHIVPELGNIKDEARYSYLWYTIPKNVFGYIPRRDTLSREKELNVEITYESGNYHLIYEIRDTLLDVYTNKDVTMVVQSNIGKGWYVLKDVNEKTDFDYVNLKGEKTENLIAEAGEEALLGKAVKIVFQGELYTPVIENPDGTSTQLDNKKAFFVLSEQDMKIFNADNMNLFKTFEECFYEAPGVRRLQNCVYNSWNDYLINDGKIYSICGQSMNSGMFGFARPGMYDLHSDMITTYYGTLLFDKNNRTFYDAAANGVTLNKLAEDIGGGISPSTMPVDLIRMLPRDETNPGLGYAVMENKDKGEYYVFDISYDMTNYPFVGIDTIPVSCEMPRAEIMTANRVASCIYYVKNEPGEDVLKVYKSIAGDNRESELKKFPGEKIVYIENVVTPYGTAPADVFNNLVVLTNSSSGWKLYRFNIIGQTPEIETEPVVVYSGQGNARYVMFRGKN
ncbi:PKD-like family lipoprotein [Butyricimonas sp.]|uniref:PKD-like family lipoprotein n=1 Tax=Butyricimonas sp. TaxID=1969738 RepID=UPI0025C66598|nr:PKD-like family lipoprotein [Butyricimonas sp.]